MNKPNMLCWSLGLAWMWVAAGCSCGDDKEPDPATMDANVGADGASGSGGGAGGDGGTAGRPGTDAGGVCEPPKRGFSPGGQCQANGDCAGSLRCEKETMLRVGAIPASALKGGAGGKDAGTDAATPGPADAGPDAMVPDAGGLPMCFTPLPKDRVDVLLPVFQAGGLCTKQDCMANRADCGECALCTEAVSVGDSFVGTAEGATYCRAFCTPTPDGRGGCPEGQACSLQGVCLNACSAGSDACKVRFTDVNGDGSPEPILDPGLKASCDATTGLCSNPAAKEGDPCITHTECAPYSVCLKEAGLETGRCAPAGCSTGLIKCGSGEICSLRNTLLGLCVKQCDIGAEDANLQTGKGGHGKGCQPGETCQWSGQTMGTPESTGACRPGNYTDVGQPNLGAPCTEDADCYSPHGLGFCAFNSESVFQSGFCAVFDCIPLRESNAPNSPILDAILPGVRAGSPVCPQGDGICVRLTEPPALVETVCFPSCGSATDCPEGFACVALDPTNAPGERVCFSVCQSNDECHPGAQCLNDSGTTCGRRDNNCLCDDAQPRCQ